MAETLTQFDYLLNAFEQASQADKPAEHDYGSKRRALYAYVRELERKASEVEAARASPADTRSEREKFEAWADVKYPLVNKLRPGDPLRGYSANMKSCAWDGWQAARASLPAPTPTSQETVAMTSAAHLNRLCPCGVATLAVCAENTCAELRAAAAKTEPPMTAMDSKPVAYLVRTKSGKFTRGIYESIDDNAREYMALDGDTIIPLFAAPPSDAAMAAESDTALLRQCLEALEAMMPTPLWGAPSTEVLVNFWETEREKGRGDADAVLAAYAAIAAARQALEKP